MENMDVKEKNMARQEKIKAAVEELRLRKPYLNFAAAWHKLQKEKPELFDFESAVRTDTLRSRCCCQYD
jgi:hypothetical protein